MSKTIYKYGLTPSHTNLWLHEGYKLLDVQVQQNAPVVWVLQDVDKPVVHASLWTFGTGWNLPDNPGEYIATFQLESGLVFHVFEDLQ